MNKFAYNPNHILPLTVAGLFFPADRDNLIKVMKESLLQAQPKYNRPWSALIVPHAGYRHSGSVAASAYQSLDKVAQSVNRVVLLSPAHRKRFKGMAVPVGDSFDTPLGPVSLDLKGMGQARKKSYIKADNSAFFREHGIEAQLPFIRQFLPNASVLPVLIGNCPTSVITSFLRPFALDGNTLIIVSTDLSHFHSDQQARQIDEDTCRQIEQFSSENLTEKNACGYQPLSALLKLGQEMEWRITKLDQKNSGKTTGNLDRVVGYASYGLESRHAAELPANDKQKLLGLARKAVSYAVRNGTTPSVKEGTGGFALGTLRRTFITLNKEEAGSRVLRGCVGSNATRLPLVQDVAKNAALAAIADRRFKPVSEDEVENLRIEISILSHETAIACRNEQDLLAKIRAGHDGLTIQTGNKRATFLPKVWEKIKDKQSFVRHLKRKAGIEEKEWPAEIRCWRYSAELFSE